MNNIRSNEAVIKINKKIKCLIDFKKNIKYITRDYQLPLYDDEGNIYEGKEEIKYLSRVIHNE